MIKFIYNRYYRYRYIYIFCDTLPWGNEGVPVPHLHLQQALKCGKKKKGLTFSSDILVNK